MKNLEQIRAAGALESAKDTTKAAVSKLPAMILANGLLATCAFGSEKKKDGINPKRPDMKTALDGTARHLAKGEVGIAELQGVMNCDQLITKLCALSSMSLQRATGEALAFLGYVKRFTAKEGSEENSVD